MKTKSSLATGGVLAGWMAASVFLLAASQSSPAAEPPELVKLYGNGVHAYFSHDHAEALNLLSQAVAAGTRDPRAYYFRGMTLLRMGRELEAQSDMQIGATLEAQDPDAYPVSRSLERVQGRGRRMLETYRRQAQFARMQQRQAVQQLQFEATERRESAVLRQQVQFGVEDLAPSHGAATPDATAAEVRPPAAGTAEPADAQASDAALDPFGEEPPQDVASEGGDRPAVPAETPAAGDDPFGDPLGEAGTDATEPADSARPASEVRTAGDDPPGVEDDASDIQVGEKVKARKLFGILGGILGKTVKDAVPTPSLPPGLPGTGPPGAADGPVGPPKPDEDDPFGAGQDPPPAEPAEEEDPFGAMPDDASGLGDPFADDPLGDDSEPAGEGISEEPAGDTPAGDPPPADEEAEQESDGNESDDPFDFG